MSLKIRFFASLREAVGESERRLDVPDGADLRTLMIGLRDVLGAGAYDAISAPSVRIAVNQTLVEGNIKLEDGDEVAFMPPVTGG